MKDLNLRIRRMMYLGIGILMLLTSMSLIGHGLSGMNKHPQTQISSNIPVFEEVAYYEDN